MDDKNASTHEVVTVEAGGVSVEVDLTYARSWQGLRAAARMASSQLSDVEKLVAMYEYYEGAIPNVDEVVAELGGDSDAQGVFDVLSEAVKEAVPKN